MDTSPSKLEPTQDPDTEDSPGDGESLGEDPGASVAPPVVAVMVARDPGPWFEEALAALGDQDYQNLAILVIDAEGTGELAERIAEVVPNAYLRQLSERTTIPVAANEALSLVEGAAFLFFCHDHVVLDPPALRLLVEEAYRSNAGVAGPKIVDYDQPELLQEVGMSTDKFGIAHPLVEQGELDQEQHDAVRDVFYVSSEAALIRADLFAELDGFDPVMSEIGGDLDLCWRARVVGARVMVVPDALARRRNDALLHAAESEAASGDGGRSEQRNRIRTLLKVYSLASLAWIVPQAIAITIIEVVALTLMRRPSRAAALLHGWTANLSDLGALRSARLVVQEARRVPDQDLRYLQVRGSARLREVVRNRLDTESLARSLARSGREMVDTAREGADARLLAFAISFVAVVMLGSRHLIFGDLPSVSSFGRWVSVGELFGGFTAPWRLPGGSGLAELAPPPPVLGFLAVVSSLALGAIDFVRTVLIIGTIPCGAIGAYRLADLVTGRRAAAVIATCAYVAHPALRNAFGQGRLGALVFFALMPFVLRRLFLADNTVADNTAGWWRSVGGLSVLLAVLAMFVPAALLIVPMVAVLLLATAPLAGTARMAGMSGTLRMAGVAVFGTVVSVALLAPWSLLLPLGDLHAMGLSFDPAIALVDAVRGSTGRAGGGWPTWGIVIAAILPLLAGRGKNFGWAVRAWTIAFMGWALVWVPGELGLKQWLSPEIPLVLVALGLSLAVALGASTAMGFRHLALGWRHVAAFVAGVAFLASCFPFLADSLDGDWGVGGRDWASALTWMDTRQGEFQILWVGDSAQLPLGTHELDDTIGFGFTRNGATDARAVWSVASKQGTTRAALERAMERTTVHLGRTLAMQHVRYLAVPLAPAPGVEASAAQARLEQLRDAGLPTAGEEDDSAVPGGSGVPASDSGEASLAETARLLRGVELLNALDAQVDLEQLDLQPGIKLYENAAWKPNQSLAAGGTPVLLRFGVPLLQVVGWSLMISRLVRRRRMGAEHLLAEDSDD